MFSTDASGQDAENGLKSVLALPENKDMQLVATAHFNITDVSVAAQLEDVKAAQSAMLHRLEHRHADRAPSSAA